LSKVAHHHVRAAAGLPDQGGYRLQFGFGTRCYDDIGPCLRECHCDCRAEAAACACDDGYLVVQTESVEDHRGTR
jgi:hypothetical protein